MYTYGINWAQDHMWLPTLDGERLPGSFISTLLFLINTIFTIQRMNIAQEHTQPCSSSRNGRYVNKMNLQELSSWVSTNHFFFFLLISSPSCSPLFSSFVFFLFLQPPSFPTRFSFIFVSLSWP